MPSYATAAAQALPPWATVVGFAAVAHDDLSVTAVAHSG
jgi:hypothetical protein